LPLARARSAPTEQEVTSTKQEVTSTKQEVTPTEQELLQQTQSYKDNVQPCTKPL
jgi:hypothetical protein